MKRWIRLALTAALAACSDPAGITIASIDAQPDSVRLTLSQTALVSAVPLDPQGRLVVGVAIGFRSSDTTVALVSNLGLVQAVSAGTARVYAEAGGASDSVVVQVVLTTFPPPQANDTSILARVEAADGTFDVQRAPNGLFYAAAFAAGHLVRFDAATARVTGALTAPGAARVTINAAGTRAYVADIFSNLIRVVNLTTFATIDSIAVRGTPVPMLVSNDGTRFYVAANTDYVYRINPASKTIQDSLATGATAHHMLWSANDTTFFVATRDGGTVMEVNGITMLATRTFTIGGRTQGMARVGNELYVTDEFGGVAVVNLTTGAVSPGAIPALYGTYVVVSADQTKLYVSTLIGRVVVVDRVARTVLKNVLTGGDPRGIAFDPGRNAAVSANANGWIDIIR